MVHTTSAGTLFMEDPWLRGESPPPAAPGAPPQVGKPQPFALYQHLEQSVGWTRPLEVADWSVFELQGRIPDQAELASLCGKLRHDPNIPFEYITDGCYARAHVMSAKLRGEGINQAKIFAIASPASSLSARNDRFQADWGYHVAPIAWATVEGGRGVAPFVLDPSMSDQPLSPGEWLHAMGATDATKVKIASALQYFPGSAQRAERFEDLHEPARQTLDDYQRVLDQNLPWPGGPSRLSVQLSGL